MGFLTLFATRAWSITLCGIFWHKLRNRGGDTQYTWLVETYFLPSGSSPLHNFFSSGSLPPNLYWHLKGRGGDDIHRLLKLTFFPQVLHLFIISFLQAHCLFIFHGNWRKEEEWGMIFTGCWNLLSSFRFFTSSSFIFFKLFAPSSFLSPGRRRRKMEMRGWYTQIIVTYFLPSGSSPLHHFFSSGYLPLHLSW